MRKSFVSRVVVIAATVPFSLLVAGGASAASVADNSVEPIVIGATWACGGHCDDHDRKRDHDHDCKQDHDCKHDHDHSRGHHHHDDVRGGDGGDA